MTVFHGTDIETAKIIIETGVLKGDAPLFGSGFCTNKGIALSFAAVKVQKYLSKGREYASSQIAIIEFEITDEIFKSAYKESNLGAFTMEENNKPIKEYKSTFKLLKWKV
ncbi:MAG: hypothetical protein ABIP51_16735 [Bacteroidia bacterium]